MGNIQMKLRRDFSRHLPVFRDSSFDRLKLLDRISHDFQGDYLGIHGPKHWLRVIIIGEYLAGPGINRDLIFLFGIFHDLKRVNDTIDPEHGIKASRFLGETFEVSRLKLSETDLTTLKHAIYYHSFGLTSPDLTVGACWDADRLDLTRLGKTVDEQFFSLDRSKTQEAKQFASDLLKGIP